VRSVRPEVPGPGQESAWDYPRPPRVEPSREHVEVWLGGARVAGSDTTYRVLETSHPPTYYLPRTAFVGGVLHPADGTSHCEWKGEAHYFDLVVGDRVAPRTAWTYPAPRRGFEPLLDHLAVMPSRVDRCTVDGEQVVPQAGGFYGGWITSRVVGPFKGERGTWGW
jgi:uncharacterized protein (DUF427 family)